MCSLTNEHRNFLTSLVVRADWSSNTSMGQTFQNTLMPSKGRQLLLQAMETLQPKCNLSLMISQHSQKKGYKRRVDDARNKPSLRWAIFCLSFCSDARSVMLIWKDRRHSHQLTIRGTWLYQETFEGNATLFVNVTPYLCRVPPCSLLPVPFMNVFCYFLCQATIGIVIL